MLHDGCQPGVRIERLRQRWTGPGKVLGGQPQAKLVASSDSPPDVFGGNQGYQLDGELVEIFVEKVLANEDVAFRHGDDADFEAELEAERRARDAWRSDVPPPQLPPPALEAA